MFITSEAGGFRDHIGVEKKKEKKTGNNVATCQRHNVPASQPLNVAMSGQQKKKLMNFSTSRRRNVTTSS